MRTLGSSTTRLCKGRLIMRNFDLPTSVANSDCRYATRSRSGRALIFDFHYSDMHVKFPCLIALTHPQQRLATRYLLQLHPGPPQQLKRHLHYRTSCRYDPFEATSSCCSFKSSHFRQINSDTTLTSSHILRVGLKSREKKRLLAAFEGTKEVPA